MIKFCVFADYHYNPKMYPIGTEGLQTILKRANDNNVNAIIHCGDFAADSINCNGFVNDFLHNKYNIPAYGCYGNHELEFVPDIELLNRLYGVEKSYYYKDIASYRFIFLDTNFWTDDDGSFYHYPGNSVGSPKGWNYDKNMLGAEQLKWFEETMETSPYPIIVVAHAALEPNGGYDREDARNLIDKQNRKTPGKIKMVLTGHYHRNRFTLVNKVLYFQVNATYNGEWQPKKHNLFPKEYAEKGGMTSNCSIFTKPLSAIVTITDDNEIIVEGMKTDYMYGVSPEQWGGPYYNYFGDKCEPKISDFRIKLEY